MKVIERKDWEKEFSYKCTCPKCESKLECESNDLVHNPGGGDCRESWDESFHVVCAVCSQHISVKSDLIPAVLKDAARDRRQRRSTNYFDR